MSSKLIDRCRPILFLAYLLALILPAGAVHFANTSGKYNQGGWYLVAVYILFIGIDQLVGRKWGDPTHVQSKQPPQNSYYSFLLYLSLPAATALSVYSAYFFSNTPELNLPGRIGWIISLGLAIATLALPAGHELIHRGSLTDRLGGGFLFALVCNTACKIEHLRGHHLHAATPADSGFAGVNRSLYHFLPRALKKTFANAWQAEKRRLNHSHNPAFCWRNEVINGHLISLGIAAIYYFLFGLAGIIFFVGQGLVALAAQNVINYIQHYGLQRLQFADGRYEKFSAANAWGCDFLFSNIVSFCLPCHTAHHLKPRCPFQLQQHTQESPQMPLGYVAMFFMALIPPLWFKVMNPRIAAYNKEAKSPKGSEDVFDIKN